jgi:hypothetical protein
VGLTGPQKGFPRLTRQIGRNISARQKEQVMINATCERAMRHRIGVGVLGFGALVMLPCLLSAGESAKTPVTFAKDVAPIFQAHCQECHHPGTAAPMSLVSYEETLPWAEKIKDRVATRNMPPWHLDRTVGIQRFKNDTSLTDEQIDTIVRWVDSGKAPGNPKDMPRPKMWPSDEGWQLAEQFGQPDIVVKSTPYTVAAVAQDAWWKPLSDALPVTEPRWVRAVEMRPGTAAGRRVTHHALAQLLQDEPGVSSAADDDGVGPLAQARRSDGGLLMEWAIGKQFDIYPSNTGKLLLPGARIRWDVHYHSVGEQIRDNVELGIYLYPKGVTPKYRTRLMEFHANQLGRVLDIPPNSVTETQSFHVLKENARFENFQPHMHLRGKAMSMEAILPDGTTQMLSYVDRFVFNWMNNYIYAEDAAPVLPKGTVIRVTAWHDNTAANPNNPDPSQWVGWGERTVDEMAHAWVNVTYLSDEDYKEWLAKHKPGQPQPEEMHHH